MVIKFYEAHIIWTKDSKAEARIFEDSHLSRGSEDKTGTKSSLASNNSKMSEEDSDDEPLLKSRKVAKKKDEADDSDSHSKENYP